MSASGDDEGPSCPFCGGGTRRVAAGKDYVWRVSDAAFEVRRCAACGFGFTADPPADLARYYTERHYGRAEIASASDPAFQRQVEAEGYKLDIVRAHAPEGARTLLEIGPSMGAFAALAKRRGFEVAAIEMDEACVRFLNEELGVAALRSDDPAGALGDAEGRYDVIALWHALEHMARPWEVIAACAKALAPGGILVVAVPNPDCTQARWMGGRWPHYDLPRHLSHIPAPWLTARAAEAGLEAAATTTRDPGGLSVNAQSIPLLLLGLTGASAERGGLSRLAAALCWRIGRAAAALLAPFDAREGRGAAYTAVFRKPPAA